MLPGEADASVRQRRKDMDDNVFETQLLTPDDVKYRKRNRKGIFYCLCRVVRLFLILSIFCILGLTVVYFVVQSPIDAQTYSLPSPPALTGALAVNKRLAEVKQIMKGQILGPSSVFISGHDNYMYAVTMDGKVLQIEQRAVKRMLQIEPDQKQCGTFETLPLCGRPLALRMTRENKLAIADAFLGIYLVNIFTETTDHIVPDGSTVDDGRPIKYVSDLDILPDDTIFFTESSSRWDMRQFWYSALEAKPDGRLLSYNPMTEKITVVLDNLYHPSGVQLSIDHKFLFVAEATRFRIIKYHLSGPKQGSKEIFVENLPGFPDKIRLSSNGSLWIPLKFARTADKFSFIDFLARCAWCRNLIAKTIPETFLLKHMDKVFSKYPMAVLLDTHAQYIASLHDFTGNQLKSLSQITDVGGALFLGSSSDDFIGKLEL